MNPGWEADLYSCLLLVLVRCLAQSNIRGLMVLFLTFFHTDASHPSVLGTHSVGEAPFSFNKDQSSE
jgi:hypothetical protein